MIAHIDMDAFYASVELRDNPRWRGKPVVVGYDGSRGVVAAASYEARKYGVFSAMPMAKAVRLCPGLVVAPPRFEVYSSISSGLRALYAEYTARVEPLALDECYLDLFEWESPGRIVAEIRSRIHSAFGLPASAGIGPNKYVAKVASGKAKPDGQLLIAAESVLEFLWPLPVSELWGVGPKTAERLRNHGLVFIEQVAASSVEDLTRIVGRSGADLHKLAWGRDDRPVETDFEAKSLSCEHTFERDCGDLEELGRVLKRQVTRLEERLGRLRMRAGLAVVKIRWPDFRTETRSVRLRSGSLWEASMSVLAERLRVVKQPVRLLGLGVGDLVSEDVPTQLELF
ncbi:MAG: DNA polymerase IV [Candidatus Eremiobacteraeota bacterium]|nr:DNA polymerase IV [Candidatus Eremiobacteraeota bacterium]MCW5871883.1 DNA polymerase IV [Candidatus Eremiobacteraeota bacterium]